MILVAAFGVGIACLFAVMASIFLRRIRANANASSKRTSLQVSDELEGELLLQSDADLTV